MSAGYILSWGGERNHRKTEVWVQMQVSTSLMNKKANRQKTKQKKVWDHHRTQHSAGVLASREQND